MEPRLSQNSYHFSVQISNNQHIAIIRAVLNPKSEQYYITVSELMAEKKKDRLPFSVFEIFKGQILYVVDQVFVAWMDGQLL